MHTFTVLGSGPDSETSASEAVRLRNVSALLRELVREKEEQLGMEQGEGSAGHEFKPRVRLGRSFNIDVYSHGLPVGHIGKGADGTFKYYRGQYNELTAAHQDPDLEALKRKISENP